MITQSVIFISERISVKKESQGILAFFHSSIKSDEMILHYVAKLNSV